MIEWKHIWKTKEKADHLSAKVVDDAAELSTKLSIIFNADWYRSRYADLIADETDLLADFMAAGMAEGRDPSPLFDTAWYRARYTDLAESGDLPAAHFVTIGMADDRDPSPLFDAAWYRAQNPDVAASEESAFRHFAAFGMAEGRDPSPLFDTTWYRAQNPDVVGSGLPPFLHFLTVGMAEGRDPSPLFDAAWYRAQNPDVATSEGSAFRQFAAFGMAEGRDPSPLFDTAWYRAHNPDVAGSGLPPFLHFLTVGLAEGRDPFPLFDTAWYRVRNPDVAGSGLPPFLHFLTVGLAEGRDPSPLFDAAWYRAQNPDVAGSGGSAFRHFAAFGMAEGRDPSPLFDTAWYRARNPDVAASEESAFRHFAAVGMAEGRDPSPLFDTAWYRAQNPDVVSSDLPPFLHFLTVGMAEGRDPSPLFDAAWYRARNSDVAGSHLSSFAHFLAFGMGEGRDPHPLFDGVWYRMRYRDPDLARMPPFRHFVLHGLYRGWDPHPLFNGGYYKERYGDYDGQIALVDFLKFGLAAGRDPSPLFDHDWYRQQNPDADGIPAFTHFLTTGLAAGRSPNRLFDPDWYRARYPDVAISGLPTFVHFLKIGHGEDRDPHPLFDTAWYRARYGDELGGLTPFEHYFMNGGLKPNRAFDPDLVMRQFHARRDRETAREPGERGAALRVPPAAAPRIVFTSITRSYLPLALVLAETVKAHAPDVHFAIVLCDACADVAPDLLDHVDEVVVLRDLVAGRAEGWIFGHDVVELCTAAKGVALDRFLDREGCETVVYLDPDIMVFGALDAIDAALAEHAVVVTPHLLKPEVEQSAIEQNEYDALRHGAFNLGFLAVRNDPAGRRFARWWRARLDEHCFDERERGLFVDQKWMDLAPGFFPELGIMRDPGCNVAPWNLSQRAIAGNPLDGFTVDGRPLVFFHFSGHIAGDGGAMMRRFAGDNPAALFLHRDYEQRLDVVRELVGEGAPWAYATYDDGRPIGRAERAIYRQRQDLQAAFPDPFAARGRTSFLAWYHATGDRSANASRWRAGPDAWRTVLDLYLARWEIDGLQPCRLFDPRYYVKMNSDVEVSEIDPFGHFLRFGLRERRRACPDFDLAFYMPQVGASDPEAAFWSVLEGGLQPGTRPVATYLPDWDGPVAARLARAVDGRLPRLLMISHFGGGGTSKHIADLTAALAGKAEVLLLAPNRDETVTIRVLSRPSETLLFARDDVPHALADILEGIGVSRIHVHHVLGLETAVSALLDRLRRPYDVTLHDTYFLSPNPLFLHGRETRDPGGLDAAMEAARHTPLIRSLTGAASLGTWRRRLAPILLGADRVIAPSAFIADVYRAVYSALPVIVAPHAERARSGFPLDAPTLGPDDALVVGVLGEIMAHKGSEILLACAALARQRRLPLRFVAIGSGASAQALTGVGVIVHGTYEDAHLPALIRQYGLQAVWLPCLAPESYSYTLSVAIESGLAVAATDAGCFPERLNGLPQTEMRAVETDAEGWLACLMRVRGRIAAGRFERTLVRLDGDAFYGRDYLAPVTGAA